MPKRADFSPSRQDIYTGNRLERFMLHRIARTALRLPEDAFSVKGRGGTLRVSGNNSGTALGLRLNEDIRDGSDDVLRFTDITIVRNGADQTSIVDLGASTYETDEEGDRMGLEPHRRQFMLGAKDNDMSLFRVMKTVSLAANTVEWAGTINYLMTADPREVGNSFPQTF